MSLWFPLLLLMVSAAPAWAGDCTERQFYFAGAHFDQAAKRATADFSTPRNQEMGVLYFCRYNAWLGRFTVKGRYSFQDDRGDSYWMDLRVTFNTDGSHPHSAPADGPPEALVRLAGMLGIVFSALFVLGQPRVLSPGNHACDDDA